MIGRYVISVVVGCFITLTLIFVMHLLIEHAEDAMRSEGTRHMLDFVRIKRNETLNTEDLSHDKPEKPPEAPPVVPPQDMDNVDPNAPTIKIPAPVVSANIDIGGPGGMNIAEGDYLPIVRVAPIYPARALSRGVEGYVDMSFPVTAFLRVRSSFCERLTSTSPRRSGLNIRFRLYPRTRQESLIPSMAP